MKKLILGLMCGLMFVFGFGCMYLANENEVLQRKYKNLPEKVELCLGYSDVFTIKNIEFNESNMEIAVRIREDSTCSVMKSYFF